MYKYTFILYGSFFFGAKGGFPNPKGFPHPARRGIWEDVNQVLNDPLRERLAAHKPVRSPPSKSIMGLRNVTPTLQDSNLTHWGQFVFLFTLIHWIRFLMSCSMRHLPHFGWLIILNPTNMLRLSTSHDQDTLRTPRISSKNKRDPSL